MSKHSQQPKLVEEDGEDKCGTDVTDKEEIYAKKRAVDGGIVGELFIYTREGGEPTYINASEKTA